MLEFNCPKNLDANLQPQHMSYAVRSSHSIIRTVGDSYEIIGY
jgi:hypothetical protein